MANDAQSAIELLPSAWLRAGARQVAGLGGDGFAARLAPEPSPWGLYESLGEALFWAAFARVEGDAEAADRALLMAAPLRQALARPEADDEPAGPRRLGGFTGLGGSIWGLATLAHLLQDDRLRRDALSAAVLVTPERVAADRIFDVIAGAAGALLALVALAEGEPAGAAREDLLARGRACAAHLLARQHLCGVWDAGGSGQLQSGFAHGASGIAYALLALHRIAPDPAYPVAAARALAFESSLYVPERDRYLPFAGFDPAGTLMVAWCWGPPGIALARAAALGIDENGVFRREAEQNLGRLLAQKQTLEDHLCCGNLGRATVYAQLAGSPAADRWRPRAREEDHAVAQLVGSVLARAQRRGVFGYGPASLDAPWVRGLLKGSPGIGFALLHLAAPHLVPCPLTLAATPAPAI